MTKTQEIEIMLDRMKRVSTKALDRYARRLTNSRDIRLEDVYNDYSANKERAYNYFIRFCDALDGYNFRILTHNSKVFTVGFLFETTTGETAMAVITPTHNYYCVYDTIERFV